MPEAPETITLTHKGQVIQVPIDRAGQLLATGWTVEDQGRKEQREYQNRFDERNPAWKAVALAPLQALGGATFGLSNAAIRAIDPNVANQLNEAKEAHPYISGGAELAGSFAAPVGALGDLISEGKSIGGLAARSAAEGSAFGAGDYISDVALQNKDLSAEGLIGSMGRGALFGSAAGAGLSLAGRGLDYAKKFFPNGEITKDALVKSEKEAMDAIASLKDESQQLSNASIDRMRGIREELATNPEIRSQHEAVALDHAKKLSDEINPQNAVDVAFNAGTTRTAEELSEKSPGHFSEIPESSTSQNPEDLIQKLMDTKAAIDRGETFRSLASKPKSIERAVNEHVAKSNPEMDKLVRSHDSLNSALENIRDSNLSNKEAEKLFNIEMSPDAIIGKTFKTGSAPVLNESTLSAIHELERAHAEAVDALGPHAPMHTMERAAALRQAENAASESTAESGARLSDDIDNKLTLLQRAGKALGKAGEATEFLHMLGVKVPTLHAIPVIGPVLSLAAKASLAKKLLSGESTKVSKTVHGAVATKSSELRNKIISGVGGALESASNGIYRAAKYAVPASEALSHSLFSSDIRNTGTTYKNTNDAFKSRVDELIQSRKPGAVQAAVQSAVPSSDPRLTDAISNSLQRKLDYLYRVMPKPSTPPGALESQDDWIPDKQSLNNWARIVHAADDPAQVFDRLGKGEMVSSDELSAIRNIYPNLWMEAQSKAIELMSKHQGSMSYQDRKRMSVMFQLPMDSAMVNGFTAFIDQSDSMAQPQPSQPSGPSPTTKLAVLTSTRLDRDRG